MTKFRVFSQLALLTAGLTLLIGCIQKKDEHSEKMATLSHGEEQFFHKIQGKGPKDAFLEMTDPERQESMRLAAGYDDQTAYVSVRFGGGRGRGYYGGRRGHHGGRGYGYRPRGHYRRGYGYGYYDVYPQRHHRQRYYQPRHYYRYY